MNEDVDKAPFVALVDDDRHSAQLLTRMMLAHGSPGVRWLGDAVDGFAALMGMLSGPGAQWPSLVIVDLKAHSLATIEFLRSIQPLAHQRGINAVAMVHPGDTSRRDAFEDAGAAALFSRHAESAAYRREVAGLVSFWARSQRLDAVGM